MSFRFIKKRGYNNNLKAKRLCVRPSVRKETTEVETLDLMPFKEEEKKVVETMVSVEQLNETVEEPVQSKRRKKNKQAESETIETVIEPEIENEDQEKTEVFENNEQNIE